MKHLSFPQRFSPHPGRIAGAVALSTLLLAGSLCAQGGNPLPPVVERYEQMLVRSPSKGTAFEKVYQHFFEGEGVEKLATRWQALAEAGGSNAANYWLLRGLLADRQGRNDEAVGFFEKAAQLKPDDFHAWVALGDLQAGAGKFAPAIAAFQKALAAGAPPDARPKIYRQLARSQQRNFDVPGAIQTWQKFVAEAPDDPFVLEEAGEALADAERFAEARALFEKLRDRPDGDAYQHVRAIMKLAQLEEQQGHAKPARALYESALPLAADASWMHREVRSRIEELFRRQDDLPGLTAYYTSWLQAHAKDVEAALRLSDVLIELNKKKEAVDWLRKAAEWAPDRQEVQVMLAKRLGETEQPREAVKILARLVELRPEEQSYLELLGEAHWLIFEKTKDAAERTAAMESWRKLAPADEKDPARVGHVADLYRAHQVADSAIEEYRRAIQLAPTLNDLRERLVEYFFDLGRDAEAWIELDALGRVEKPDFLRLSRLQARHGAPAAALASVQQGLERDPKNFDLLSLEWQMLAEEKRWPEVLALFDTLSEAAPNAYFIDDLEARYLMALEAAGKGEEFHKTREEQLGQGTLSERDLRLLTRQLLSAGDFPGTRKVLDEGHARFANSFPLARLEVEYARRSDDLEGRIRGLRRLIELQPKLKSDILRDIANAYREGSHWDEALAAVQELITAAPANADAQVLGADTLLAAGRFEEGVKKLREAVRLSDNPNSLRLRLSRVLMDSGDLTKAREVLDEAFEAADKPGDRLALMPQLTEAYFLDSKLDTLVDRFRQRQRGEDEGWRYALYLAEIYKQTLDFGAARRELARALAARPRDSGLLRQMVHLAGEEENHAETARYQELLTDAEPSDNNQAALVEAYLRNNQPEPAFTVLQRQFAAVNKVPGAWDRLMPMLTEQHLLDRLNDLIVAQAGVRNNVDVRLQLAVIQIGQNKLAEAREALWEIFAMPSPPPVPEPPAATSLTKPKPTLTDLLYNGSAEIQRRLSTSYQSRQVVERVMNPGNYSTVYGMTSGITTSKQNPVDFTRDNALLYLAALAVRENQVAPFLTELDQRLEARGSSGPERLLAYAIVQAKPSLLQEIRKQAHAEHPEPSVDLLCLTQLGSLLQSNRYDAEKIPVDKDDMTALYQVFRERVGKQKGSTPELLQQFDSYFYSSLGEPQKLQELRKHFLEKIDPSKPENLIAGISMAAQNDDLPKVKQFCAALAEALRSKPATAVQQQLDWLPTNVFTGPFGESLPDLNVEARTEILATVLAVWYPASVPRGRLGTSGLRYWQGQNPVPESRFFDPRQVSTLANLAGQFNSMIGTRMDVTYGQGLPLLRKRLAEQAQTLPEAQRIYPQLIAIYFDTWSGNNDGAQAGLQPLLEQYPNDEDLLLLGATLLQRQRKYPEAMAMLNRVPARLGVGNIEFQKLLLGCAKLVGDNETARKAALRLASLHLYPQDRQTLLSDLRALGLNDRADLLAKQTPSSRPSSGSNVYQTYQELQRLTKDRNETAATTLARQILSGDPLTMIQNQYAGTEAIRTLQSFDRLDAFIEDTKTGLAQTPDSLRLNYLLALAEETREAPRGTTRYGPKAKLPCWLKLAREGGKIVGSYSQDGQKWTEVSRITIDLPQEIPAGMVLTGKEKEMLTFAEFGSVSLTGGQGPAANAAPENGLPAPWVEKNIGKQQKKAASSFHNDTFRLQAGGGWIGFEADALQLVSRPLSGDGALIAQITDVDVTKGFGEAGLMFRQSDDPKSFTVSVVIVPDQPVRFKYRLADGSTEKAWRRVVELRPDERKFQQQLAIWLKNNGRGPEALKIYEDIFEKHPDCLMELTSEAAPLYQEAKRLDDLTAKVVAWRPAPKANNGDPSYYFSNYASTIEKEKRPDLVEKVCRQGLALLTYEDGSMLTQRLAKSLRDLGRQDEVLEVLAAYFLPAPNAQPRSGPATLGFQSNTYTDSRPRWQRSVSIGNAVQVSAISVLNTAQELGVLPALVAKIEEAAAKEKSPTPLTKCLQAYLKLRLRDPAAIDGLRACLAENKTRENTIDAMLMEAAREIKSWPGQEAMALEIQRALRAHVEADQFLSYGRNAFYTEIARTEEQLGDPALPQTLHDYTTRITEDSVIRGAQNRREFRWKDAEIGMTLLLRAGLESEYLAFIDKMKKTPEGAGLAWNLEEEARVFRGEGKPQAMFWLNDPAAGQPPAQADVAYELRSEHPHDHGDVFVFLASRGRSVKALEKERTLRFLYGPARDALSPLGELTTSTARGAWPGNVPLGAGWAKIVVTENGTEFPSPAVPVMRAANLITNPAFEGVANREATAVQFDIPGWTKLPSGFWKAHAGGPRGDGTMEFEARYSRDGNQRENLFVGQRIPLEKGKVYQQSGWLRAISTLDNSVDLGRRYLDADGKVLQTTYCPVWWGYNWRWHTQRLAFETLPETEQIPAQAAFLQPVLRVTGAAEWSGLFLGGAEPAH